MAGVFSLQLLIEFALDVVVVLVDPAYGLLSILLNNLRILIEAILWRELTFLYSTYIYQLPAAPLGYDQFPRWRYQVVPLPSKWFHSVIGCGVFGLGIGLNGCLCI